MSDAQKGKRCIACRSPLEIDATICPVCKSQQAAWRNTATFFAGLVGLLALLASAATYVVTSVAEFRKEVSWKDDIAVVHFASNGNTLIANIGSGEVFVTLIEVYFGNSSRHFVIDTHVPQQKLVSVDTRTNKGESTDGWAVAAAATPTTPADYRLTKQSGCIRDLFMSSDHPHLQRIISHYKPRIVVTSEVTAMALFVAGKSGSVMCKNFSAQWLLAEHQAACR